MLYTHMLVDVSICGGKNCRETEPNRINGIGLEFLKCQLNFNVYFNWIDQVFSLVFYNIRNDDLSNQRNSLLTQILFSVTIEFKSKNIKSNQNVQYSADNLSKWFTRAIRNMYICNQLHIENGIFTYLLHYAQFPQIFTQTHTLLPKHVQPKAHRRIATHRKSAHTRMNAMGIVVAVLLVWIYLSIVCAFVICFVFSIVNVIIFLQSLCVL